MQHLVDDARLVVRIRVIRWRRIVIPHWPRSPDEGGIVNGAIDWPTPIRVNAPEPQVPVLAASSTVRRTSPST